MRLLMLTLLLWTFGQAQEAIVVLGAAQWNGHPSPIFAARLEHAAQLYQKGAAPRILVTGGRAPGAQHSEGRVGCHYLERLGVPSSALLCETLSRSTWENLKAARTLLGPAEVIIVTDAPHLPRALLYARRLGLQARGAAVLGPFRARYWWRERLYYLASLALPHPP